jgi:trimethyllysine dioxygenase
VEGTPYEDPEDTRKLLDRIVSIRATHYAKSFDFIPDLALADPTYTNQLLPVHTDTTYFAEPVGLQAFHVLSHSPPSTTAATAGLSDESLLVDGYHAARIFHGEDPVAYEILHKVKLPWYASSKNGCAISPDKKYPVLEVDEGAGDLHSIHRIRWNNEERGVVPYDDNISPTEWYEAARKWNAILGRTDIECRVQLVPGKTLSKSSQARLFM